MATVTKDVIVLVPGFLGSVLEKDGKELWGLSKGALLRALLSLGSSVGSLELRGDGTDELASDGVTAPRLLPDTHLLPGLWKVDGYTHVSETLISRFGLLRGQNYFEFPYDWRRDVRLTAKRLARRAPEWLEHWRHSLGGSPDSRLILVAHSLGGLVSRYFLEVLGGWRHTRALITFGTPHRGSLIALDKLANGFQKKLGPLPVVDLTRMVRSLHPIYQLLPRYPCVGLPDGSVVRPTEATGIPHMDLERARQGREFMLEIDRAVEANLKDEEYLTRGYLLHPVVGINQPTLQGARLTAQGVVEMLYTEPGGGDPGGDGTVPRVSAMPLEERHHPRAMYSPTPHASLQNAFEVLAHVEGLLTGHELLLSKYRELRGPNPRQLSLRIEDAYAHDEPVTVRVRPSAEPVSLVAWLVRLETGETFKLPLAPGKEGWHEGTHPPLPPGVYRLTVKGGPEVIPVSDVLAVFPQSLDGPLGLPEPQPEPEAEEATRSGEVQNVGLGTQQPVTAEAWDESHAITRTPSVEPLGPARAGQQLSLRVDLKLEGSHDSPTESTGFTMSGLDPNWKQLPIEVHVACPGMTFGEGDDRGVVLVRRDQKSVAATLTGLVNADAKGELVAMVTFEHNGRLCGFARRRIAVEAAPGGGAGTSGPSFSSSSPPPAAGGMGTRGEGTQGSMSLEAEAAAPHLTVYILRSESSGPQRLQWLLTVPVECEGLPARMSALVDVGADGAAFFRGVAAAARELRPGEHYAWFQGLGRLLYERTPPEFRQAYQALRRRYGPGFPIQLVTNEPHIPWELMLPADVPQADLLCLEHPVGRWLLDYQTWMTSRLPRGDILTVAPDYTYHPHLEPLPQAQVESRLLQQRFNAQPVRGRRREVLGVLTQGHERPVALLHFAGHGSYSGDPVVPSRIFLEDGALLTLEVRSPLVLLGHHSRPLVLFNACEVGASSEVLGSMGGWAEAFISQRFGGFIAPMWPVQDAHARAVAERLLADMLEKGLSVGEALRSIRASEARTSPTYLSYVYVGDVLARLTPQAAPAHQGAAA